jgi:hypothetical protein
MRKRQRRTANVPETGRHPVRYQRPHHRAGLPRLRPKQTRGWYLIGSGYTGPDYRKYKDHVQPVIDTLDQIHQYGHSRYDVFTDWLDLMLYSLQRRDDPYLDIVNQYDEDRPHGERAPDLYSKAFGQLQQGMAAKIADLLGVIYKTMGHDSDAFGQYFTPHNVSEMKAEMVLGSADDEDVDSVADPACGSGRLLVSAAKRQPDALYYGADKDGTCARMTALNLLFFNVDGYAVHADSLTQDHYAGWQTRQTPFGGAIRELDVDDIPRPTFEQQAATEDDDLDEQARAAVTDIDLNPTQATFDDYRQ